MMLRKRDVDDLGASWRRDLEIARRHRAVADVRGLKLERRTAVAARENREVERDALIGVERKPHGAEQSGV